MDRRLQSYPQVLQDATLPLRRVMLRRSLQYCHGIPAFFVPQIHGAQTILRIVEMLRVTFWSFYYGTGIAALLVHDKNDQIFVFLRFRRRSRVRVRGRPSPSKCLEMPTAKRCAIVSRRS